VSCSPEAPSCPDCGDGFQCALLPPTCDQCQQTQCVAAAAPSTTTVSPSSKSSNSGPNVGAIAGGVIGGILAIAAVTYLVWRFCIKTKRQQYEQEDWIEEQEEEATAAEKDFTMRRDARASTHTVASIASTVLTRASNIIQIAYIPGVTNRSAPSTPGLLVPPVPPIPIALSSASTPRYEQEHFFMPGDLRDSTYSGISDRTSYARTSVASTIYGKNAVVSPVPAQTVIRGKAAVVSVKSNGVGTPGELTPPVPNVDYDKYGIGGPPSPAFSVGSTFLNNASAATQVRPQVVRVESGPKKMTSQNLVPEDDLSVRGSVLPRDSNAITIIDDTPPMQQGPFSDSPVSRQKSNSSLSAVIEEATKKSQAKKGTPFGDEHEMEE
jgi:protein OPY2